MILTPHNNEQPMSVHRDVGKSEIFQIISNKPLQTLLSSTMPVGIIDKTFGPRQDTAGDAPGQAEGNKTNDVGRTDTGGYGIVREVMQ